jgi:LacI family sucrose operon transcriptional repressor
LVKRFRKEIERKLMATLKDIAEKSACSVSLVSRVLNPNASIKVRVSREKRRKIQEAAEALGFMRNVNAQFLRQGKTAAIGAFLLKNRNSLICDLGIGISNEACKHNFPINYFYGESPECFARFLEHNLSASTTGIITYPYLLTFDSSGTNLKLMRRYLDNGGHAVFISYLEPLPEVLADVPVINIDNTYGGKLAAERLASQGCNEFFANIDKIDLGETYAALRLDGFAAELKKSGYKKELLDTAQIPGLIKQAVSNKLVPGVFSLADKAAVKVMNECSNRYGLKAGRDYKIVGYDDLFMSDLTDPPLTTINQNLEQQGTLAVKKLVNMICHGKKEQSVVIKPSLIIRDSA